MRDSNRNNRGAARPKTRKTPEKRAFYLCCSCLAGDEGFEPPITGPEPVALPLGQSPLLVRPSKRAIQEVIILKKMPFDQAKPPAPL